MKKLVNEVGKSYPTTRSGDIEIVEYFNYHKVLIRFKDTGREKFVQMKEVRDGRVSDRFLPHRGGVGVVGEGEYKSKIDGKYTKEFAVWKDMVDRCCSKKGNLPAYKDVEVCEEWLDFQNFAAWCNEQIGFKVIDEKNKIFALDKDILVKGNKVYSPNTCCFVPQEVNSTLTLRSNHRGSLPLGVSPRYVKTTGKTRFTSAIQVDLKTLHLGTFDTPEKAFQVYKKAKEDRLKCLAEKWKDFITEKCYNALLNWEIKIDD